MRNLKEIMPEAKSPIWSTVLTVLVGICIALTSWGLQSIVELRAQAASDHVKLQSHNDRLNNLEVLGSAALQKEMAANIADHSAVNKRVDELRIDYGQRMQNITSLLEKMVTQQTELIAFLKAKETSKP